MINRDLKRCMGQMMSGIQVVAAKNDDLTRAYCSHWVHQVSFDEPIMLASISPKHDTHALIEASGWFTASILSGDQVEQAQYFSYPGRKFKHIASEYLTEVDGNPVVVDCIAWLRCEVMTKLDAELDHDLYLARVTDFGEGRIEEMPLLYSARQGWRTTGESARERGVSVRDRLIARLEAFEAGND